MRFHSLPRLAAPLLSLAVLSAQRPSSWVPLPLTGAYTTAAVDQLGKTVRYLDGNTLWFGSGFARQWRSVTVTNPSMRVFNDLAYAVDGNRVHAFSSYRGSIETLTCTGTPVVINPTTQRNDSILLVVDGGTLWAFSSFRGQWVSRPLLSGSQIVTQRHTALVADGTQLAGMSAFTGTWVATTPNGAVTSLAADGSWGAATTASTIHGFSAQRGSWSTAPLPSGSQRFAREDCVLFANGQTAVAYSGLRGGFAATAVTPTATVTADAVIACVQDGQQLQFYSAVLGSWTAQQTSSVASITVRPHLVTVNDNGTVYAYSPFIGNVVAAPVVAGSDTSNQGVAAVVDQVSGQVHLYSALTGAWVQAPTTLAHVLPDLIWCGALVATGNGYLAYSGRSGAFVPLVPGSNAVRWTDANSSVLAVEDDQALHVFEPRRATWLSVPKQNPAQPLQVRIWRTTLLAIDGSTVHAYGNFAGELESVTLPSPPSDFTANSESCRAALGSTVLLFGATPDLVTLYQYPEFRRVYTMGSDLEVQWHGEPGAPTGAALGFKATAPVVVPGLGELLLQPATVHLFGLGTLPMDGRAVQRLFVPDLPALRGVELMFQGVVLPAAGTGYLTRLASVRMQ